MNSVINEETESALRRAVTTVNTNTPSEPLLTDGTTGETIQETPPEETPPQEDAEGAENDLQEIDAHDSITASVTLEGEVEGEGEKSGDGGGGFQQQEDPVTTTDVDEAKSQGSAVDIGEIPLTFEPSERRHSNLTVHNLKLHEEKEREKSFRSSPTKTPSQHSVARTSSPLAPLKGTTPHRSVGQASRQESGQRSSKGHHDGVVSPVPSGESLRPGSVKPLPPIEKVSDKELDVVESRDSFTDDDAGPKTNVPRILGFKRESSRDNDSETVISTRSAKAESVVKSERSVSFIGKMDRSKPDRDIPSPANREVIKTKNADGSEKVAVSIATETEWSWLESVRLAGRRGERNANGEVEAKEMRTTSSSSLPSKRRHRKRGASVSSVRSRMTEEGATTDLEGAGGSDSELEDWSEKDEEEGGEEEYSDGDEGPLPAGTMIPRIGPPRIIQYQRESEHVANHPPDPSKRSNTRAKTVSAAGIEIPSEEEMTDGGGSVVKSSSSGLLAAPKGRKKRSKSIASQKGATTGSRISESRSMAGSPSNMEEVANILGLNDGGPCEFCHENIKPFPTPEMLDTMSPSELYCCEDYQNLVEFTLSTAEENETVEELIDVAPHAPFGSKQARRAAKERAAVRMREREMARQKAAGSNQANFYASHNRLEILDGVARQMKTINYSLSSQKCMDEGWTVRAPTPSDDGYEGPDPYEAQPVFQAPIVNWRQKSKKGETNIMKKTYENGKSFMILFEDGTGSVFYPSGNVAVVISSCEKGQYQYLVQDDTSSRQQNMLGLFEPNGRATVYQNNGQIKLNLTPYRGLYLDQKGCVKKRWLWKDTVTHTHAPPFQPICFSINKSLSLRCMAQDQMFLHFSQEKHSIRFNVGVKLKLVKPENLPKDEIDEHLMYLADITAYFKVVADKIHNQIKFSKSPKLSSLQLPYQLQKNLLRNEKMKTKKVQQQADKGQPIVTVN